MIKGMGKGREGEGEGVLIITPWMGSGTYLNSTRRKSCLKRDSTSTLASGVTLSALSHANGGVSFIFTVYHFFATGGKCCAQN